MWGVILLGVGILVILLLIFALWYIPRSVKTQTGNKVFDLISLYQNWKDADDPAQPYVFQIRGNYVVISYFRSTGYISGIVQLQTSYSFPDSRTLRMVVSNVIANPVQISQPRSWTLEYFSPESLRLTMDGQVKNLRLKYE